MTIMMMMMMIQTRYTNLDRSRSEGPIALRDHMIHSQVPSEQELRPSDGAQYRVDMMQEPTGSSNRNQQCKIFINLYLTNHQSINHNYINQSANHSKV
jgi:hypothetical protein